MLNNRSFIFQFAFLALALNTTHAHLSHAEGGTNGAGNGGSSVYKDGHWVVADPNDNPTQDQLDTERVEITPNESRLYERKLWIMEQLLKGYGLRVDSIMRTHQQDIRFMKSTLPCNDPDSHNDQARLQYGCVVGKTVFINYSVFKLMDPTNQALAIAHELFHVYLNSFTLNQRDYLKIDRTALQFYQGAQSHLAIIPFIKGVYTLLDLEEKQSKGRLDRLSDDEVRELQRLVRIGERLGMSELNPSSSNQTERHVEIWPNGGGALVVEKNSEGRTWSATIDAASFLGIGVLVKESSVIENSRITYPRAVIHNSKLKNTEITRSGSYANNVDQKSFEISHSEILDSVIKDSITHAIARLELNHTTIVHSELSGQIQIENSNATDVTLEYFTKIKDSTLSFSTISDSILTSAKVDYSELNYTKMEPGSSCLDTKIDSSPVWDDSRRQSISPQVTMIRSNTHIKHFRPKHFETGRRRYLDFNGDFDFGSISTCSIDLETGLDRFKYRSNNALAKFKSRTGIYWDGSFFPYTEPVLVHSVSAFTEKYCNQ